MHFWAPRPVDRRWQKLLNMILQSSAGDKLVIVSRRLRNHLGIFGKVVQGESRVLPRDCKRVFPLAVRFLKVISPPANGANAVIYCTRRGSPEALLTDHAWNNWTKNY